MHPNIAATAYRQFLGKRVEVEFKPGHEMMMGKKGFATNGRIIRFTVGRSMGPKKVFLMLLQRNSTGGMVAPDKGVKRITLIGR
jgi:hypothetical protein